MKVSPSLHRELQERLDTPELDEALAALALPEVIAGIMHDLGLETLPGVHPGMRRTPHHASTIDGLLNSLPTDLSQWTDAQLEAAMAKAEYEARRSRGSG